MCIPVLLFGVYLEVKEIITEVLDNDVVLAKLPTSEEEPGFICSISLTSAKSYLPQLFFSPSDCVLLRWNCRKFDDSKSKSVSSIYT